MATGGQKLVAQLHKQGARRVFCVAGESYLPVLDALLEYPSIDVVTCRHESGAAFMAEAHGMLTGEPGLVMVTRGPGACNASIGVHAAMQASTPQILFVGLVATKDRDKESFQEFDLKAMFGPLCKWAAVIEEPERTAEYVARAYHVALSGRPGPVVLGLPANILKAKVKSESGAIWPLPTAKSAPDPEQVGAVAEALKGAQRPLVLVGGSGWRDEDCDRLADFVSAAHLPVVCGLRRQDIFANNHGNYIGDLGFSPNPALLEKVRDADVILVLGARLNEITTQSYTLFHEKQSLIHVHPEPAEFGKGGWPSLGVQADAGRFVSVLAAGKALDGGKWADWRAEGRAAYLEWTEHKKSEESLWRGADMTAIFHQLRALLPGNAIVTTDSGNFSNWATRYLRYARPGRLLAPVSGSMGYAVPAALSASLECPERLVLGICGDGGFMMSSQELSTAVQKGAKPMIMVCNNNMFGTIHMHQQRDFPGRVSATALTNPDFVKLGGSYGAFAARVEDAADFEEIWNRAVKFDGPALIEIVMDPRQITTTAKL